jgi:hypothetical protein
MFLALNFLDITLNVSKGLCAASRQNHPIERRL